jgi:hypothetical protein
VSSAESAEDSAGLTATTHNATMKSRASIAATLLLILPPLLHYRYAKLVELLKRSRQDFLTKRDFGLVKFSLLRLNASAALLPIIASTLTDFLGVFETEKKRVWVLWLPLLPEHFYVVVCCDCFVCRNQQVHRVFVVLCAVIGVVLEGGHVVVALVISIET